MQSKQTAKDEQEQFATREVVIVPYDPAWKDAFERIRQMLDDTIGAYLQTIEHVGSTSVEGLGAKPVIDVDAVLRSADDFRAVRAALEACGYQHQGDLGLPGREAFFRPKDYNDWERNTMKYHLYVCFPDAVPYREHLAFRDYLRAHPQARQDYQQLKEQLAEQFRYDVDSYCERKTEFVRSILARCSC